MTKPQARKYGEEALISAGISNASYESLWLLESVTGETASKLLASQGDEMTAEQEKSFTDKIAERIAGRPIQYIIGKWEFYGREFYTAEGALIPRPETELLVDFALDYLKGREDPVIIDLCAGTGCIGLTLASLIPGSKVYLVEKYDEAFAVLRKNAQGVSNAEVIKGDILEDITALGLPECDLLLSNPPYIKSADIPSLQAEVLHEPLTALDGGEDGLVFYRALKKIIPSLCRGAAAFECGEDQGEDFISMFPGSRLIRDCYGNVRVLVEGENRC